jgi:hypothetical protein
MIKQPLHATCKINPRRQPAAVFWAQKYNFKLLPKSTGWLIMLHASA